MFGLNNKIDKALQSYENGEYEKSYRLCCKVLKSDSQNTCILITLGNIFYMQNKYEAAAKYYEQAIKIAPDNYSALINLANSYYEIKQYDKSIEYANRAAIIHPKEKVAYTIMGNSYGEKEQYSKAIDCFKKALEIDNQDAWLYNYLSQNYQKNGSFISSLSCAWKAVRLGQGEDAHHINLGYLFYEISTEKGLDSILECLELWYKEYGKNPIVAYTYNALLHNTKIKVADSRYVKNIFDIFAPDFESVLTSLDYQAPFLIEEMLKKIYTSKKKNLRILDLGCGTGWCGVFLKNYARSKSLYGIDLSEKMLSVAQEKNIYSKLIKGDIISYLKATTEKFDLMVSSDVFTYFGALEELFENINKCLSENGRLVFTISENNMNKDSYFLHASGRFLHSLNYIKNILKKTCFEVEKLEYKKLRNEGDKKVMGYIVSAHKI